MRRPMTALSAALAVMTPLLSAQLFAQQPSQPPARNASAAPAPISLIADASQSMSRARSARALLRNGRDYIGYGEYERALELLQEAETRQSELSEPERLVLQKTIREAREGLRSSDSSNQAVADRPRQGSARQAGAITLGGSTSTINPASLALPAEPIERVSATAEQASSYPAQRIEPVVVQAVVEPASADLALPTLPTAPLEAPYDQTAVQPAAYVAEPSPLMLDENGQVLVSEPLMPAQRSTPPAPPAATVAETPSAETPLAQEEPAPAVQVEPDLPALPLAQPEPEPFAPAPAVVETTPPQAQPLPVVSEPPPAIVEPSPAPVAYEAYEEALALPELPSPPPPILSEPAEVDMASTPTMPVVAPPPNLFTTDTPPPPQATPELAQVPADPVLPIAEPDPALAASPLPTPAEELPPQAPIFGGVVEEPTLPILPSAVNTSSDRPEPVMAGAIQTPAVAPEASSFLDAQFPSHLQRQVEEVARRQEEERRLSPTYSSSLESSFSSEALAELGQSESRIKLPRPPSPTLPQPIRAIPVPENFVPLEPRQFAPNRKVWAAAATCHGPLYFQDPVLERYGQSVEQNFGRKGRFLTYPLDDPSQSKQRNQLFQPLVSAGLFAAQIAALPYQLVVDPPWESEFDLGYYRPNDRIPPDTYYLPWHGVGPPLNSRGY